MNPKPFQNPKQSEHLYQVECYSDSRYSESSTCESKSIGLLQLFWVQRCCTGLVFKKRGTVSSSVDIWLAVCVCSLWPRRCCLTRSRRCPGCALGKIKTCCRRSGRSEATCTTTASRVSPPKKYQREFGGEYWLMTWGWWVMSPEARMLKLIIVLGDYFVLFQGKTLTTIALILTNFHQGKPLPVEICVSCHVISSPPHFIL